MTTWVVPDGTWQLDQARDDDVVLRHEDGNVLVGKVVAGSVEWLGPAPEGALDVPQVSEPTEHAALDDAVTPVVEALRSLGG